VRTSRKPLNQKYNEMYIFKNYKKMLTLSLFERKFSIFMIVIREQRYPVRKCIPLNTIIIIFINTFLFFRNQLFLNTIFTTLPTVFKTYIMCIFKII